MIADRFQVNQFRKSQREKVLDESIIIFYRTSVTYHDGDKTISIFIDSALSNQYASIRFFLFRFDSILQMQCMQCIESTFSSM